MQFIHSASLCILNYLLDCSSSRGRSGLQLSKIPANGIEVAVDGMNTKYHHGTRMNSGPFNLISILIKFMSKTIQSESFLVAYVQKLTALGIRVSHGTVLAMPRRKYTEPQLDFIKAIALAHVLTRLRKKSGDTVWLRKR